MSRRKPPKDTVIYWDAMTRSWWGFRKDAEGNQLGHSVFAYRYNDCHDLVKDLVETA